MLISEVIELLEEMSMTTGDIEVRGQYFLCGEEDSHEISICQSSHNNEKIALIERVGRDY